MKTTKNRQVYVLACALLLAGFAALSFFSSIQKSATADEPVHLFGGYSYLKWDDYRVNPEHPPLAKMWAALPLLVMDLNDSRPRSRSWDIVPQSSPSALFTVASAAELIFEYNDGDRLFFLAKLQMIVFALLLGVFVFLWAKKLSGAEAGLAALALFSFDPNFLAHTPLVHTDVAFSAMFFIGSYFYWCTLKRLSWKNLGLTAFFFALAAVTKYAYLAMGLIWSVVGIWHVIYGGRQAITIGRYREFAYPRQKLVALLIVLAAGFVTAYGFIWAIYGFRFDAVPFGGAQLAIADQLPQRAVLREFVTFLYNHRLFPEAWIYGQLYVFNNLQREAYLLGAYSEHGFLWYFPVAFALKSPLPLIFLLAVTIVMWVNRKRGFTDAAFLAIPALLYFGLAIWSRINIGIRHILPLYPFLFVICGVTVAELWRRRDRLGQVTIALVTASYLWVALGSFPHYLAYFNELIGGPKNGHKALLDSNIDWGQDLKLLKRWMNTNNVSNIHFLYFGFHDAIAPRFYGIGAHFLPGSWVSEDSPPLTDGVPDFVAISVNQLYGHFLRSERRESFVRPFRYLKPVDKAGHSIHIFRLSTAISDLQQMLRENPSSAHLHADLGSLLETQGNIDRAIDEYRVATKLNPSQTKALYNWALVEIRRGNLNEAIELLRKAAASSPKDEDILYDLALALVLRGEWDDAIRHFQVAIGLNPRNSKAHYNLGVAFERKGAIETAIQHYRSAISLDVGYSRAYYRLGVILSNRGAIEPALQHFRRAVQVQPNSAEFHQALGEALSHTGRKEEAIKHYEAALRIRKFTVPPVENRR